MKLYLTKKTHQKIRYYVEQCQDEISGLGKILLVKDPIEGTQFVVHDVEIFEQKVSGAHSTIDEESLAKFLYEKTKAGAKLSEYRFWWHSHAAMGVFFSGTDTGTIDASTEFPWLVSFVTNHKGEMEARFDLYEPIRMTKEKLGIEILEDEDLELKEQCKKEIELKVRKSHEYGYQKGTYSRHDHKGKKGKKRWFTPGIGWEDEDEVTPMNLFAGDKKVQNESTPWNREKEHTVLVGSGKGKYSTRKELSSGQSLLSESETLDPKPH